MSDRHAAHPLLRELEELIASRESAPRSERLIHFARALLGRTLHERLRTFDLEELYRQTTELYDFADARGLQPIAVRMIDSPPAGTALELNVPDAPFLVDTVRAAVQGAGYRVRLLLHPIVGIERDADGRIVRVADARESGGRESVMRLELERQLARDEGEALVGVVHDALADLQLAVGDFAAMQATVARMAEAVHAAAPVREADEVEETAAFLDWLREGHFILLGAREYEMDEGPDGASVQVKLGSGLGILRDDGSSRFALPSSLKTLPEFLSERLTASGDLLVIGKTNRISRVHRRARMDDVSVRVLRPDGTLAGLLRVIGLFTSLVYLEQASRTPLLRRKLQAILEAEGLIEGSHDYKAMVAAFESFPRDELFQAPVEALRAEIVAAARAEEAQRVTLTERRDAASRNITVMVAMPGDRMSTELRIRLQNLLAERYGAQSVEYHLALVEGAAAQLFFLLHIPEEGAPEVDLGRAREGSRPPGTHLGRPLDRRAGGAPRRRRGEAARGALLPAAARVLQDRHLARARARRHRVARARGCGRAVRGRAAERVARPYAGRRAAVHARDARDARRQDPAGPAAARARSAGPDGHGGGADAPRRRR